MKKKKSHKSVHQRVAAAFAESEKIISSKGFPLRRYGPLLEEFLSDVTVPQREVPCEPTLIDELGGTGQLSFYLKGHWQEEATETQTKENLDALRDKFPELGTEFIIDEFSKYRRPYLKEIQAQLLFYRLEEDLDYRDIAIRLKKKVAFLRQLWKRTKAQVLEQEGGGVKQGSGL